MPLLWVGLIWLMAQPAGAVSAPVEPPITIDFFEREVVGSYRLSRIEPSGRAHYVQFQRRIQQVREGHFDHATLEPLLDILRSDEFSDLSNTYDVQHVLGAPEVVYEDIYYRLRIDRGGASRVLVAHQQAAPPILRQFVSILLKRLRSLPRRAPTGLQFLVVDTEIARQIRWLERVERTPVSLDDAPRSSHLLLRQAAARPGWPQAVPQGGEPEPKGLLGHERTCVDLVDRDRRLAACVLGVESDPRHDLRR